MNAKPSAGTVIESLDTGKRYAVLPRDDWMESLTMLPVADGRLGRFAVCVLWEDIAGRASVKGKWTEFLPLARQVPVSNIRNGRF